MTPKRPLRLLPFAGHALLVALVLLAAELHYSEHYPAHGATLAPSGVANFGEVTPLLLRGGQPSEEGLQELKKLGVEWVVNFRNERDRIESERRQVEALGMCYASIPWSSWRRPNDRQVAEFLALLQANPQRKIFVHCHHGADRTGVMVAAYRIAAERWTSQQALTEMAAYHFHSFWMRHLKGYVEDFPRRLEADPNFRALHPVPPGARP